MIALRRSLFITFFSTNAMTVVQFATTLVLARLLSPAEVGIFSITAVVVGLAAVFRDFGVSSYLQREAELTPAKTAAALGLLLATSWLLAALLYLVRHRVAAFYGHSGIADVMQVLTLSFVLLPVASYFYALLSRELNAGKQAIVNAVGTVAHVGTCLTLAFAGHSYMSLAWANVANIAATIVVYLALRPPAMVFRPSLRGWRAPATFGCGAILGNLVSHLHLALPELVLGKLSGPHAVGLYSRANGLVGIFQQVAGPTVNYNALPFIAASHHARVALGPILAKATSFLTGLALPAFAVTAIFAHDIILVLYGATWLAAAPLVAILCASHALRIGYALCTPALTAIGRPYLSAIAPAAAMAARLALIVASGASSLEGLALALLVADLLVAPVPALLMARYLGYSVRQSLAAHGPSVALAAWCALGALLLKAGLPQGWPALARLAILAAVMAPLWLAGVLLLRHPLRAELPQPWGRLGPT